MSALEKEAVAPTSSPPVGKTTAEPGLRHRYPWFPEDGDGARRQ
jgi:hypothetical protein